MSEEEDLGFAFVKRQNGDVEITHQGRIASTLRGDAARSFLCKAEGAPHGTVQQLMARITGNYKRGNERTAKNHPRNR